MLKIKLKSVYGGYKLQLKYIDCYCHLAELLASSSTKFIYVFYWFGCVLLRYAQKALAHAPDGHEPPRRPLPPRPPQSLGADFRASQALTAETRARTVCSRVPPGLLMLARRWVRYSLSPFVVMAFPVLHAFCASLTQFRRRANSANLCLNSEQECNKLLGDARQKTKEG